MTPAPEDPAPPTVLGPDQPAAGPPRSSTGRLPPWAPVVALGLLVLLTLALVGGWRTLASHRAAEPVAHDAAVVRPPIPTLTPMPVPTTVPATPVAHPTPTTSHRTPIPAPSASASAAVDRSVPVVVLNATGRTGLAARAAGSLRAMGWTVAWIGNWRGGGVGRTTVFATGYDLAARTLRADEHLSTPVRRSLSTMTTSRLVLVLGPDYPR